MLRDLKREEKNQELYQGKKKTKKKKLYFKPWVRDLLYAVLILSAFVGAADCKDTEFFIFSKCLLVFVDVTILILLDVFTKEN